MMFVIVHLCSRVFPRRRIAFNIPTQQMRYFRLFIYFIPVFGLCFDLFGNAVDAWLCVRVCLCVCSLVRVCVCEARAQEKNTVCLFHDISHEI